MLLELRKIKCLASVFDASSRELFYNKIVVKTACVNFL
jgi:hypothetical protein